ncbi:hypothetical protein DMB66_24470 [Actinoplanes sp. ATCC 53533]|uniref:hypothetical protein n=1 Tax=Actinoplanes sp. ATCC 53533 TaxID=1288362 RepID=UPI000F79545E|nr:hypothetical protein [Actinoplanes sp. ATCC 53533]RSM61669.1 hypothetical protein DMB66_24470 [Actinoplanes sp. ATCC 53533]
MDSARPLRDVFADLTGNGAAAGDPEALLRDQGHPGLPDHLVAEAVVSYAETAPAEVAEHLAPYVTAHSVVGAGEPAGDEPPAGWLDLLGTAPAGPGLADEPADIDYLAPSPDELDDATDLGPDPGFGLDFGTGAELVPAVDAGAGPEGPGAEDLVGAGVEGPGGVEDIPADQGDLGESGDMAVWVAAEEAGEPATEDEPGPDGEPLG